MRRSVGRERIVKLEEKVLKQWNVLCTCKKCRLRAVQRQQNIHKTIYVVVFVAEWLLKHGV
jgi:hypothetical protein